jgi:hypothetical protein
VFLSVVNVEEKVMRVWRGWLEGRARVADEIERDEEKRKRRKRGKRGIQSKVEEDEEDEEESNDESDKLEEEEDREDENANTTAPEKANSIATDPSILWTDANHNVGLRVTVVKDRKWHRNGSGVGPILIPAAAAAAAAAEEEEDEEESVSYNLEIQGQFHPSTLHSTPILLYPFSINP